LAAFAPSIGRQVATASMIALLFAHQMLEYLGIVALWAWWGDLVPEPVRGRYFARRQRIQLAVTIPTLLAGGYFADYWRTRYQQQPDELLLAYAIPTGLGALFLLASLGPLFLMPATRRYPRPDLSLVGRAIAAPFVDRRFWPLLVFRGWFSLANGISQLVQNVIWPKDVLGLGVGPMSAMRVGMQVGQFGLSRSAGKWSDRYGNRPVLVAAQAAVSLSLVFYLVARPGTGWLLAGAWLLYSAYVVHNICLPNLTLKLSPELERPAYVAASEAIGSLLHAASTIGGGILFDYLRASSPNSAAEPYRSGMIVLVIGLAMRSLAVPLLAMIREPGAWSWRGILSARVGQAPRA
jgi:MFS family permease